MADFSFSIGSVLGGSGSAGVSGDGGGLVAEAQQNLLPDFQCDAQMLKLVASYVSALETVESATNAILELVALADYQGRMLDDLGEIVGQERNGLSDALYRQAIAVKIVANSAQGDSDVLIFLARQALCYQDPIVFIDSYPAGFIIEIPSPIAVDANVEGAAQFLRDAKAGGVLGVFTFHTVAPPFQYDMGSGYDDGAYATGINV